MIIACFLYFGYGNLFSEEAIRLDNYQYPHREVRLIPLWFCCSCQLNYIIPICGICPETSPQARGQPGYYGSLGQGLMEQFFSLTLQQS